MSIHDNINRTPAGSPDGGKFAPDPSGAEADASTLGTGAATMPGALVDEIHSYLGAHPRPDTEDTEAMQEWLDEFDGAYAVPDDHPTLMAHVATQGHEIVMDAESLHGQDDDTPEWGEKFMELAKASYSRAALQEEAEDFLPPGDMLEEDMNDDQRAANLVATARQTGFNEFAQMVYAREGCDASHINALSAARHAAREAADRHGRDRGSVHAARDVTQGPEFAHPTFAAVVKDAAEAQSTASLVGTVGYTQDHYDTLMADYNAGATNAAKWGSMDHSHARFKGDV